VLRSRTRHDLRRANTPAQLLASKGPGDLSAKALAKAEARYTRWRPGRQSQPSLLWSGISRILCPLSRTGDHLSHAFFTCPRPLLRVRPIPEVHSPLSRKVERATHTSALSCTTWGLSRDLAYAKIRWALTPPFHPCPAPSFRILNGIEPSDLLAGAKLRRDGAGRFIF
jgi:hypothetical protein